MRYVHMTLLSWKPEYSVNEAELDSHHIKLFDILNKVYENVMNSLEVDCVLPNLNELSAYTSYHLSAEEQHMREKGFPNIDEHIAEHRDFTHKIETLKTHYHGNNLEVSQELIILLGNWLLRHVLTEDKKYSELSTGIKV
jgi:hemerythrin